VEYLRISRRRGGGGRWAGRLASLRSSDCASVEWATSCKNNREVNRLGYWLAYSNGSAFGPPGPVPSSMLHGLLLVATATAKRGRRSPARKQRRAPPIPKIPKPYHPWPRASTPALRAKRGRWAVGSLAWAAAAGRQAGSQQRAWAAWQAASGCWGLERCRAGRRGRQCDEQGSCSLFVSKLRHWWCLLPTCSTE
jgi:hypothetical protein